MLFNFLYKGGEEFCILQGWSCFEAAVQVDACPETVVEMAERGEAVGTDPSAQQEGGGAGIVLEDVPVEGTAGAPVTGGGGIKKEVFTVRFVPGSLQKILFRLDGEGFDQFGPGRKQSTEGGEVFRCLTTVKLDEAEVVLCSLPDHLLRHFVHKHACHFHGSEC